MDDDIRALSQKLYGVLERVGVSEGMRGVYMTRGLTVETLNTLTNQLVGKPLSDYIFGSMCEGTTTSGLESDQDAVFIHENLPVVENLQEAPNDEALLIVTESTTRPGYVKLQLVTNGVPCTSEKELEGEDRDSYKADKLGRWCLRHVSRVDDEDYVDERSGPADTVRKKAFDKCDIDLVDTFRCRTIPRFCEEWTKRERKYGWPSEEQIDEMKTQGCFVVGVGHPQSEERDLEWRISFSFQERGLMFSLSPVQHKCYVLLKMIKKDLIKAVIEQDSLSSYHCKTCLFHVIENNDKKIWTPENLMTCVLKCLSTLHDWVQDGYCPNFFIKEENMFERRVKGPVRDKLLSRLKDLISVGPGIVYGIHCDDIGIQMSQESLAEDKSTMEALSTYANNLKYSTVRTVDVNRKRVLKLINCMTEKKEVLDSLNTMKDTIDEHKTITEHSEEQSLEARMHMKTYVHSLLMKAHALNIMSINKNPEGEHPFEEIFDNFRLGQETDAMSTHLVFATILFKLRLLEKCCFVLEELEFKDTISAITLCSCGFHPNRFKDYVAVKLSSVTSSLRSFMSSSVATCVRFIEQDWDMVPDALKYEMRRSHGENPETRNVHSEYWFDWAVVDSRVYIYFLQYLVYDKLARSEKKQAAIEHIQMVLESDLSLGHTETAYNLLGWIYLKETRLKDAKECFTKSLEKRPVHNAAKWHLRKLHEGVDILSYFADKK